MHDPIDLPGDLLGRDGPLARHLPHFRPRPQQQAMAHAVASVLARGDMLVAEAGTGTGKTFAYLVPVLASGRRTVISTGTHALQEQLFHRDIPLVREALGSPARVALLKGRSSYLCRYRLELAEHARDAVGDDPLPALRAWAEETERGEISECHAIAATDPFWQQVTSTVDNCLGTECPAWNDCHVVRARRAAMEADIVVVNHHLLFSDLLLRQEGHGELLPDAAAFVIDEAHQLPEIASRVFGIALSARQLVELARDSARALRAAGGGMPELEDAADVLEREVSAFRRVLGPSRRQAPWTASADRTAALDALCTAITHLRDALEPAAPRDKALDGCWRRSQALGARAQLFARGGEEEGGHVRWLEAGARSFTLHLTPLDFSATFRGSIARFDAAWVFTSATLAVGERFEHFTTRLGIDDAETARWDSPFDYPRNTLCYIPGDLPDPGVSGATAAVVDAVRPVLDASRGRAFLLFTSHHALREAARLFEERPPPFPVFVQGTLPHQALLAQFLATGDGVLLGTGSFWEGVDVRGSALSLVLIDKLPFAPPDDPVFQARAGALRSGGGNPFRDLQLPEAVIALKQGAGRLIRDVDDRGVLMLCDPRLFGRSYGRVFLDNLPPMPRTRALGDVIDFFAAADRLAEAAQ